MCVFVIREEKNEEEGCGGEVEVPSGSEMRCEVALKVPHKSHCPPRDEFSHYYIVLNTIR